MIAFKIIPLLSFFSRAKEDSSYAGYHLAYEVKKLMYAVSYVLGRHLN